MRFKERAGSSEEDGRLEWEKPGETEPTQQSMMRA